MDVNNNCIEMKLSTNHFHQNLTEQNNLNQKEFNKHGLSLLTASIFIAGLITGGGILALPKAMDSTGFYGICLICLYAAITMKCCLYLSNSWIMIENKWPQYKNKIQDPYPLIGELSIGKWMKIFCSILMDLQLFGASLVYLLFGCEFIANLSKDLYHLFNFCNLIIFAGLILCPIMWLGSPQDFKMVGYGAMLSSSCSAIIILILFFQYIDSDTTVHHSDITLDEFLISSNTILFCFGGAVTMPTFQNDMKDRTQFPIAIVVGFILILFIYIPMALGGYLILGSKAQPNILTTFPSSILTTSVNLLMAFHVLCAFLIVSNPLCLELEKHLNIPYYFNWKRVVFRTCLCFLIIFMALSLPNFDKVMGLVGATTVTIQNFVLPPWFYMNLCRMHSLKLKKAQSLLIYSIMIFGALTMVIGTYTEIKIVIQKTTDKISCFRSNA